MSTLVFFGSGELVVSNEPELIDVENMFSSAITLRDAIGEAVGAASVCWSNSPNGVFDEKQANRIVDDLVEWVERNYG